MSVEMGGCPQETGEGAYPFPSCPLGVPQLGSWASSLSPVSSPGTSVVTSGKQDLLTTPVALPHLKMVELLKL